MELNYTTGHPVMEGKPALTGMLSDYQQIRVYVGGEYPQTRQPFVNSFATYEAIPVTRRPERSFKNKETWR